MQLGRTALDRRGEPPHRTVGAPGAGGTGKLPIRQLLRSDFIISKRYWVIWSVYFRGEARKAIAAACCYDFWQRAYIRSVVKKSAGTNPGPRAGAIRPAALRPAGYGRADGRYGTRYRRRIRCKSRTLGRRGIKTGAYHGCVRRAAGARYGGRGPPRGWPVPPYP